MQANVVQFSTNQLNKALTT